ncbi:MAG: MATE family efflux transporter [Bacteroidia bacterium]|jgi:putative MATE family efflux protein|nr:MATE family efflux transporter [Bacteroidia bacterium]MBP7245281.1 MATE family efflux transporter [Bacteroidia bacterium]
MKVQSSYSDIWRISWPIILSSLANTVINFTDVAFVSRLGEKELAASALGGVFYFLLIMIAVAIGIGSQILIARKAGEGKHASIGNIFDHCLLILLGFSFLMVTFVYQLIPAFMSFMVKDKEVVGFVIDYLNGRTWGLPFMTVFVAMRSFYTGITLTRIITYTTVLMMLLNVVFNYLFVFGSFGCPAWGIYGAGIASAIAESAAAVYAVIYALSRSMFKEFQLFKFKNISQKAFGQIMKLSTPIIVQHFFSMGSWFIFFLMIEKLGSRELAISNILRGVYMFLMTPVWGFSECCNSMVSNLLGQKKISDVLPLAKKIMKFSFAVTSTLVLLCILFQNSIFELVSSDVLLNAEAKIGFYVICFATLTFSLTMIAISGISGTGATAAAMRIEIVSLLIYLSYVFTFTHLYPSKLEIVWLAEVFYWTALGLIGYAYLRSGKWIKKSDTYL